MVTEQMVPNFDQKNLKVEYHSKPLQKDYVVDGNLTNYCDVFYFTN